jgi:hypothetical protein
MIDSPHRHVQRNHHQSGWAAARQRQLLWQQHRDAGSGVGWPAAVMAVLIDALPSDEA